MAKKPDDDKAQDIGEIVANARKRPMNFAAVIGKNGVAIAADPRKGAEVMWRQAKEQAGGTKGAMGSMSITGKEMHLQVADEDFPGTLKKTIRKQLAQAGHKLKVIFMLADGSVVGGGDDDEDDEEESAAHDGDFVGPPIVIGKEPEKSELTEEFVEVRKNLMKGMAHLDGAGQAAMQKHIKHFGDLMKATDFKAAQELMDDLSAMIGAVTDPQRIRAREDVEQIDSMVGDIEVELDALETALDSPEAAA